MTIFRSLTSRLRRSILLKFVAGVSLALIFAMPTLSQTPTRDKFLWYFSSTSPWNMPIGSGAIYIPANIQKAQSAGADLEYLFKLKEGDPCVIYMSLVLGVLGVVQVLNLWELLHCLFQMT